MTVILGLLSFILFIALIVGLIKPAIILRWTNKPTRLKVFGYWILAIFIIAIMRDVTESDVDKAKSRIETAKNYIEREKFERAISSLEGINKSNPFYLEAQQLMQEADSLNKITKEEKLFAKENISKKEQEEIAKNEQFEKIQVDSFNYYTHQADSLKKRKKYNTANESYIKALTFSDIKDEGILTKQAQCLSAISKYDEAILVYNDLIYKSASKASLLYERAICYNKIKKVQEAVSDLKEAIELGNKDAEKLHNKINPLKKRILYYVRLCCDGTTSNATGRGACSHHGGVCEWNHPIYEEYRKY